MNREETLKTLSIWEGDEVSVKPLNGGLTNENYLVVKGEEKFVCRFTGKQTNLIGLDKKREIEHMKIVYESGLCAEFVDFIGDHDLMITRFIEGNVYTKEIAAKPESLKNLGVYLRKLHDTVQLPNPNNIFEEVERNYEYVQKMDGWKHPDLSDLYSKYKKLTKECGEFRTDVGCHLDLVLENIIETKNGVMLIDWEYSGNSDRDYEIGMFFVFAELSDEQENKLLDHYGGLDEMDRKRIQKMKEISRFREGVICHVYNEFAEVDYDFKKRLSEHLGVFKSSK